MNKILEIKNLNKYYGSKHILKDLNISLEGGKVIGLLGPNGSGKTTLLKIIASLAKFNSGEILINGLKPSKETKAIVSYLSDKDFLDNNLKIKDALSIYKDFFEDFDEEKAINLLNETNLDKDIVIRKLSKGMREKLYLILTLSRNAKLFILDEPIAAVDVVARDQILNLIINNINEDSTLLITTHLIKDIERIFDEVGFLKDGKVDKIYNVDEIREKFGLTVEDYYREIFKEGM